MGRRAQGASVPQSPAKVSCRYLGAISHLPFKSNPSQDWPRVSDAKSYVGTFFPCSQARTGVFYLEPGTSTCLSQCQPLRLPSLAYNLELWPHRKKLYRNLTRHGPDSITWAPEQIRFPSPSLYHPQQLAAQKAAQGSPGGCLAHQGLRGPQKRCQVHEACRGL